ncbi:MAG: helix-turn-helix transcriptional regulator [Nocardioides sp.]
MTSQLVGRDAEGAQGADRTAVLLAGDAGVGKTRLLTELRDRAQAAGWRVVAGHCLDFSDSALPYLPFSEIVGRLARELPDLLDDVATRHPALVRLLPGRRMLARDVDVEPSATDQAALLDAVHALLESAAQAKPLLVVVEDLHWADRSSRDLLSFLFSRGFDGPVALVASYRSDDLHRRHPLRRQVTEWVRMPGVERLQLDPLPPDDVRALARQLHPRPLADDRLADIVTRAEGNAFFVEELVGAAGVGGGRLPDDLADILLLRLEQLDEAAVRTVRAAAVAGRRVSHEALAAAAGVPEAELDRAIRAAVDAHVLVPSRHEYYEFRHALLAEAVYDDLLPGERLTLHAAYAEALRTGRAQGTAAELARHARQARDLPTALTASLRAGDDARAVGGAEEAADHYLQALELWRATTPPDDVGLDHPRLVGLVADALIAAGHPARALGIVREQVDALPSGAPDSDRGQLLGVLAGALSMTETADDPVAVTAEAVTLVPDERTPARARVLGMHARMLSWVGRLDEARDVAATALALAQRLEMPRLATDIRTTLVGLDHRAAPDSLGAALRQVIDEAVAAEATTAELRGRHLLGIHHLDRGELDDAAEAFGRTTARAGEVGTPWVPYAGEARWMHAHVRYLQGRWAEALELAEIHDEPAPRVYAGLLTALRSLIAAAQGRSDALELAEGIRPLWSIEGMIATSSGMAELLVHETAADQAAALATYQLIVETLQPTWGPRFAARVRLAAATIAACTASVGQRSTEERLADAVVVARLHADGESVLERIQGAGTNWGPEGRAWASRLEAEVLRWQWAADVDPPSQADLLGAWRETEADFAAYGAPYELARVRAHLARVLAATGDPAEAKTLAGQALVAARELGADPLVAQLRGVAAPATRRAHSEKLTRREREILALVAEGRTNGEIGRQLFITTKTVSVHVSNILGKLGASGRTEAAALARRDGLLP